MLILVSTPIGNLADLSFRAVETLKRVDLILCEDTRTSGVLLKHYDITTKLMSFHKFNEMSMLDRVLNDLKNQSEIALMTDAGTPSISDPGQVLVQRCHEEGIAVTAIPGPSAPIAALTLSGFPADRFQFLGFLPKKAGERKRWLIEALFYPGISLFFESPKRIQDTLLELEKIGPEHRLAIVREMTKQYEECLIGVASKLKTADIRGELVLIVEGHRREVHEGSIPEHVEFLMQTFSIEKQEAMKLCASLLGISKKAVYSCLISDKNL